MTVKESLKGFDDRQAERNAMRQRRNIRASIVEMRKEGDLNQYEMAKERLSVRHIPIVEKPGMGVRCLEVPNTYRLYYNVKDNCMVGYESLRKGGSGKIKRLERMGQCRMAEEGDAR